MKNTICKPATPLKRFLAFVIDVIVSIAYIVCVSGSFDESIGQDGVGMAFLTLFIINVMIMTRSTTLGKLVLNMKVINRRNGKDLKFVEMFFRETLGKFISLIFFAIGFIWIMIDNEHRAWHDLVFGTLVVELIPIKEKVIDENEDEFFVQG